MRCKDNFMLHYNLERNQQHDHQRSLLVAEMTRRGMVQPRENISAVVPELREELQGYLNAQEKLKRRGRSSWSEKAVRIPEVL